MWKRADDEVRSLVARLMCESSGSANAELNRSEKPKKPSTEAEGVLGGSQIEQAEPSELFHRKTDTRMSVLRDITPHRPKNTV